MKRASTTDYLLKYAPYLPATVAARRIDAATRRALPSRMLCTRVSTGQVALSCRSQSPMGLSGPPTKKSRTHTDVT